MSCPWVWPIKLQIDYICMGNWVCADDNNSPVGLGQSPQEAVESYFEQQGQKV